MSSLKVSMVAADRKMWEGEASFVRARTVAGELGIMPGHQPLLGVLGNGEVSITDSNGTKHTVNAESGFLSVDSDVVTIVAERVEAGTLGQA